MLDCSPNPTYNAQTTDLQVQTQITPVRSIIRYGSKYCVELLGPLPVYGLPLKLRLENKSFYISPVFNL